ncbi:MAG TPA: hypothetical protein VLM89_13955 [Phycisphaerae bacterium]|nr:hypothetical protein [Phycisphaerae bacterium]
MRLELIQWRLFFCYAVGLGALLPAVVLLSACRDAGPATDKRADTSGPVVKDVHRGPIQLTIRADQAEIRVGDRLRLFLEVTAPENYEISLPKPAEALGEWRVREARDQADVPVRPGRLWRREYELESDLPGEFEIPSITVRYAERPTDSPSPATQATRPAGEIDSPPLTVKVASVLKGDFKPDEFVDIKGPVSYPWEWNRRWLWIVIAGLILGFVLVIVWRRRSRQVQAAGAEPIVPPHVWAMDRLRELRGEHLVEHGLVAEFYFRLTTIVRVYIERRFAVRAAEQTTEEFLVAAKDHPALGGRYGRLLTDFLQAGDLVKFARYQPGQEEIEGAFGSAETFVAETAAEMPVDPGPAGGAT